MIDNVVNMIEGIKNKVDGDLLLANLDPLGMFPEIKNIKVIQDFCNERLWKAMITRVFIEMC